VSAAPRHAEPLPPPGRWVRAGLARRLRSLRWAAAAGALLGALAWLTPPAPEPPAAPSAARGGSGDADGVPAPNRAPPVEPVRVLFLWRDADGELHLTSENPAPGSTVETIPLESDPAPASHDPTAAQSRVPAPGGLPMSPLSVYTPGGLRELGERLAKTRRLLEEREQTIEDLCREAAR